MRIAATIILIMCMMASGTPLAMADETVEPVVEEDIDPAVIHDAAQVFAYAPDRIFPGSTRNMRLDMIDYFKAGMQTPTKNNFEQSCLILSATPEKVVVREGEGVTHTVFVIDAYGDNPVIGVIDTVETPVEDSAVKFYDSGWRPLGKTEVAPRLADWLTPEGKKNRSQVEESIPFILAEYDYLPESREIVVKNNIAEFYPVNATPEALAWLQPQLVYKWNGKKFVLQK